MIFELLLLDALLLLDLLLLELLLLELLLFDLLLLERLLSELLLLELLLLELLEDLLELPELLDFDDLLLRDLRKFLVTTSCGLFVSTGFSAFPAETNGPFNVSAFAHETISIMKIILFKSCSLMVLPLYRCL